MFRPPGDAHTSQLDTRVTHLTPRADPAWDEKDMAVKRKGGGHCSHKI